MLRRKTNDEPGRAIGEVPRSGVAVAEGRTLGASLFTPTDLARKDRRHQRRLARVSR